MNAQTASALVSTDWLAENLGNDGVRILDASWYLPTEKRDPHGEYVAQHIPGAVFFDIDTIADTSSDLPHMFPTAEAFAAAVSAMGIKSSDHLICYDGGNMAAASRCWWMFRCFGHAQVSVLNGGFRKWQAEGRPLSPETPAAEPSQYRAVLDHTRLRSLADIQRLTRGSAPEDALILDARSPGRFNGSAAEPRPGMRSGHMPGAQNLPYTDLLAADGTLLETDELRQRFQAAGLSSLRPVITSCGSGVSAAVLLLALHVLGRDDTALYDGSWAEWGSRQDTEIVT